MSLAVQNSITQCHFTALRRPVRWLVLRWRQGQAGSPGRGPSDTFPGWHRRPAPGPPASRGLETEGGSRHSRALIPTPPVPGPASRECRLSCVTSVSSSAEWNLFPLGPSEADTGCGVQVGGAGLGGDRGEAAGGGQGQSGAEARHASESTGPTGFPWVPLGVSFSGELPELDRLAR